MPITPRTYETRPYVKPTYDPDTRTLLELMRAAGQARSSAIGRRGQAKAQGLMTLGEVISGVLQSQRVGRERQQLAEMAMAEKQAERAQDEAFRRDQLTALSAERDANRTLREDAAAQAAEAQAYKRGGEVAEAVGYGSMSEPQLTSIMQGPAAGRARYVFGPGTAEGPELQPTRQQAEMSKFRETVAGQGGTVSPTGSVFMPPKPPTEPLEMMAARGDPVARRALEIKRSMQAPPAPRQPIWIIGPDGQFKDLAGVAPPGSKPANIREQGRPVVSGDANRIAEFDTSLNDVDVLSSTLQETQDATGIRAQVGAAVPNWATNLTGWGIDAKKRQGVIDRVKQVIGKALEGGVLRKEDEYKYTKILPTIGDPPDVAASKLNGLRAALVQRRQTTIDALSDAGYDTSRFQERTPAATDDPVDALIKKYGGGE